MNKILFSTLSLVAAVSLNATVFATVNGMDITEREIAPIVAGLGAWGVINLMEGYGNDNRATRS